MARTKTVRHKLLRSLHLPISLLLPKALGLPWPMKRPRRLRTSQSSETRLCSLKTDNSCQSNNTRTRSMGSSKKKLKASSLQMRVSQTFRLTMTRKWIEAQVWVKAEGKWSKILRRNSKCSKAQGRRPWDLGSMTQCERLQSSQLTEHCETWRTTSASSPRRTHLGRPGGAERLMPLSK